MADKKPAKPKVVKEPKQPIDDPQLEEEVHGAVEDAADTEDHSYRGHSHPA